MAQLQIVQQVNRSMECSSCGAAGIAACDCGAPYMPASAKAAVAIAADPNKSNRAIAAALGVDEGTVRTARKATAEHSAVDTRVGLDGKVRNMPQRKTKPEQDMPTQEEADESYQNTLYDHACQIVDTEMSGETRQRFFAHLKRKYDVKHTQSDTQRRDKGLPA